MTRPSSLGAQPPLTLQRAVALAREQGYQAGAARAALEAGRQRNRVFYGRLLPQLSISGTVPSYSRAIIPVVQPDGSTLWQPQDQTNASLAATLTQKLPLVGGEFFVTSSLARFSQTGENAFRSWTSTPISFGVRQELLRPNASAWDQREEPFRQDVAERQYLEAMEDIAIQTANLFFNVLAAQLTVRNQELNAAANDTLFTLNKGRFEVGKIGENDLLQSELALLRARNSAETARLDYQRAAAALRLALNLPPDTPLEIALTSTVPDFDADPERGVSEALGHRSAISQIQLSTIQARRRVAEARFNNWLGATISASYGFNATAPERRLVYSNLLEARQFALSVEVPLWQWGVHKGTVEAARADEEQARNLSRITELQTAHEARYAALQLTQARRTLSLSAKADTVAGKRYEVAYNRYLIGRIPSDNLFLAQNEKDQALSAYVQALRGYWDAYYRLRRATLYDFEAGAAIR